MANKESRSQKPVSYELKIWVILIFIVVILLMITPSISHFYQEATDVKAGPPIESTEKARMNSGTWHEIARWEGKSMKNTETFHSSSKEWRISWNTWPSEYGDMNFQIYVYKANGDLVDIAANVIGKDKDSSIMRGIGDYYLQFNTAQPYVVFVEAKY